MIIVFEGGDGVGKTSVINELKKDPFFSQNNFVFCKEPAEDDEYLKAIRKFFIENENYKFSDFLLLMASRVRHFKKFIIPNLDKKHFIFDRYYFSSLTYQLDLLYVEKKFFSKNANFKRSQDSMLDIVKTTFKCIVENDDDKLQTIFYPSLVFYFYCDLKTQIARQNNKRNEIFRFETLSDEEKTNIYNKYNLLNDLFKLPLYKRIIKINTSNRTVEEIKNKCLEIIKAELLAYNLNNEIS